MRANAINIFTALKLQYSFETTLCLKTKGFTNAKCLRDISMQSSFPKFCLLFGQKQAFFRIAWFSLSFPITVLKWCYTQGKAC